MKACSINGEIRAHQHAQISVMDHGLLYGDGVFEGLRFYEGEVFAMQAHLDRLFNSAAALCIPVGRHADEITDIVTRTIAESGLDNGYVRLIVTRGEGPLGIDPSTCGKPNLIVIVDELRMVKPSVLETGAKLIIASTRSLNADQLDPRIKSMNYVNHILARIEANAAGADEAVMLNAQGRVAEGTADNIFIVKRGTLITPPDWEGSLAGITRGAIINAARTLDIEVREQPIGEYDLFTADECFLTGTGAELIPVREISGRMIKQSPGPVFKQLAAAFKTAVYRTAKNAA